jgi:L-histidine Nalpha-methyltransferase
MSALAAFPAGLREPSLAAEIREGLLHDPPRLPAACFYDETGSALFEAITTLPAYGLTRADMRLLTSHAHLVSAHLPGRLDVVELGGGSGRKARILLEAVGWSGFLRYRAIDVSVAALDECRERLAALAGVEVLPLEATYLEGLQIATRSRRAGSTLLVLFLGSNLGNLDRPDASRFLNEVRACLRPGDGLLVSVDLQKDEGRLLAAYDDPAGVSAAFNRNALERLNRELGADFDVAAYEHRALYDARARRVEMHLVPLTDELVRVEGLGLNVRIEGGKGIWTESSHKFAAGEVPAMGLRSRFRCAGEWIDLEWPCSLSLLVAR